MSYTNLKKRITEDGENALDIVKESCLSFIDLKHEIRDREREIDKLKQLKKECLDTIQKVKRIEDIKQDYSVLIDGKTFVIEDDNIIVLRLYKECK